MNKRKITFALGIVYGLYLFAFAFCCLALSIAIAMVTDINVVFTIYVFPVLGVLTIIAACLSKKSIIFTRVVYTISTIAYLAMIILFIVVGLYAEITFMTAMFIVFAIFGIVLTVISYLVKKEEIQIEIKE